MRYYFRKLIIELKINQNHWYGVFLLLLLVFFIQFLPKPKFFKEKTPLHLSKDNFKTKVEVFKNKNIKLMLFNPNELTENGWMQLGFSQKQVRSILKYKKIVGGKFSSKEQIKKCFVISEQKFNEVSPYIVIKKEIKSYTQNKKITNIEPQIKYKNFDPNDLDSNGWQKLGFTEKQTESILKYKKIVGGRFSSKEQIKKCFVINKEKYEALSSYISLNDIPVASKEETKVYEVKEEKLKIENFNPNELDQLGWQKLGFSEKQVTSILKYKKLVGGQFTSKGQIKKCYVISEQKYLFLEPFMVIE